MNWNQIITTLPTPHLLQTWEWGQVKSRYGWQPFHLIWDAKTFKVLAASDIAKLQAGQDVQAAALVLVRAIPMRGFAARLSVVYVPKGPVLDWHNASLRDRVIRDLRTFAHRKGAIFLKIDPDVCLGTGLPNTPDEVPDPLGQSLISNLQSLGFHFSQDQIQYRNTVTLDLTLSEDDLLARMKQKTRYNIRLAAKKGVTIRTGTEADLDMLYRMYAETSVRDGFVIREQAYYLDLWHTFLGAGLLEPLIAEVNDDSGVRELVSGVMLFKFAGTAYYLNGMSRDAHREKMPNYLLQWEAARRAKAAGCTVYDLWGAPNEFNESDPMWGVFRFKEGLGGQVVRHIGAWDLPVQPVLYRLYTRILPRVLNMLRGRGKVRTRQEVELA